MSTQEIARPRVDWTRLREPINELRKDRRPIVLRIEAIKR